MIKNKILTGFIAILMITTVFTITPNVKASSELDQSNTTGDEEIGICNNDAMVRVIAQSFKPTMELLSKVKVKIKRNQDPSQNINLYIRSDLSGANLASASYAPSEIPGDKYSWINFDFSDIAVTPESTYYIVLETSYDSSSGYSWRFKSTNNPYSRGGLWIKRGTDPWTNNGYENADANFETYGEEEAPTSTPIVTTLPVVDYDDDSALLDGDLVDDGGGVCQIAFKYRQGTSGDFLVTDWKSGIESGEKFTLELFGLNDNTLYQIKAGAKNSLYEGWGEIVEFTTESNQEELPSVTTNNADAGSAAILHGTLDNVGGENSCEVWFVWDTEFNSNWNDYDHETEHITQTETGGFEETLNALLPGTAYHFRAVASNDGGTVQGGDKTFTTDENSYPSFDPEPLDFGKMLKDKTATKTFEIWNSGDNILNYEFSWDEDSWITDVSPSSGTSYGDHHTITVNIDTTGLSVGVKTTYIYVGHNSAIYPYDYPVTVEIKRVLPPENKEITSFDVSHEWTKVARLGAFHPIFYFDIDESFVRWPSDDESKWLVEDTNHRLGYGLKANKYTGYARAALSYLIAEDRFPESNEVLALPVEAEVVQCIGASYTVPNINSYNAKHNAKIKFTGDFSLQMAGNFFQGPILRTFICIKEGANCNNYPETSLLEKNKLLSDTAIQIWGQYWVSDATYHHFDGDEYFLDVQLEEGKTYSIFLAVHSILWFKGRMGSMSSTRDRDLLIYGDQKFWLDSIEIEYHNPPVSPPAGEHSPEVTTLQGPGFLTIEDVGTFVATANDADGDDLLYRFDWGDGTTSEWETSNQMSHKYGKMGIYYVRTQTMEDTEYMLKSELSESMEVCVRNPQGTILINSPVTGSKWEAGSTQSIEWTYDGESINEVYLTLHKKSDPDFIMEITEDPIPSNSVYSWEIPENIALGDDYQIAVWSIANCSFSNEFSIVEANAIIINTPPETPNKPNGPTTCKAGVEYTFTAFTTDTDGDEILYKFDWGDNTYSNWGSGTKTHSWSKGTYNVRVKAKDIHGDESPWSKPLTITVTNKEGGLTAVLKVDPSDATVTSEHACLNFDASESEPQEGANRIRWIRWDIDKDDNYDTMWLPFKNNQLRTECYSNFFNNNDNDNDEIANVMYTTSGDAITISNGNNDLLLSIISGFFNTNVNSYTSTPPSSSDRAYDNGGDINYDGGSSFTFTVKIQINTNIIPFVGVLLGQTDTASVEITVNNPTPIDPLPIEPITIDPIPINIDPTPINIDPTPINIDPTPINIDPTPINIDPTPINIDYETTETISIPIKEEQQTNVDTNEPYNDAYKEDNYKVTSEYGDMTIQMT